MKRLLLSLALCIAAGAAFAQRHTDALDRGLVAVKTTKGVFCSWRIPAGEYYDVTYNVYRDGTKLNSEPLTVSNYTDAGGTATSTYAVEAVVRGVAQAKSAGVTPWASNYLEVKMDHGSLTSTYRPNDACCADVDGDGEVEILLKFDNRSDAENLYKPEGYNGEYAIVEVYKLNGKKLWWLDFGPNMGDFQNNENNIVAFDWDEDGKAEALMRAADGTTIHKADGTTVVIGDNTKNYRSVSGMGASGGQWFMHDGAEYLVYMNGATGDVYDLRDYPLKRLESGETDLSTAWGDGYGHRSSKYFFGAPFLDGRHPSIFLARGIYTRHKMIAYDVDATTHQLVERWRWNCSTSGSQWYGQGYHNYSVADVDWDGRDEIVYGSMVIDDNGKGLSTTGLGHGDSHHVGDFDPYSHGQEVFACNEDKPGNNFRDATTSKIYYRYTASSDDGRANMGNFIDDIPGAVGVSSRDANLVGAASHKAVDGDTKSSVHITQNFRIYWDGDLCEESFDYRNGKDTEGHIVKARKGEIAVLEGSLTNNDTKGTPDFQGDILGDWREEVIMRTADNNIRIYTTTDETPWRNYSLWHDHQYRNAMVWQMCGYNQTPHASYYLGELEGITVAPPPLTTDGRTEVANGASIGSGNDNQHILLDETNDMTVAVSDGAAPYILTDNAPTWVQGHDNNSNITTETYTHTLTGGAFTGSMRLVKQGDGTLVLPNVVETYTGSTDVWAGTLSFDGTLQSSRLWLNRHTSLISNGGKFQKGLQADYNASIYPGGIDSKGDIETDSLILNFGSRLVIDLFTDGLSADVVKANVLKIGTVDWENGPAYSTPVVEFVKHPAEGEDLVAPGKYLIAEIGQVDGDISNLVIEGLNGQKKELTLESGKLYITITNYVAGNVTWTGSEGSNWDLDQSVNFVDDATNESLPFVPGDNVTFDDSGANTDITVVGNMAPSTITFNNETTAYTLAGDSIVGSPALVKNGVGSVAINNVNHIGSTTINGGTLTVSSLANEIGVDYGALGGVANTITIDNGATLGLSATATTAQTVKVGDGGATLNVASGATLTMAKGFASVDATTGTLTKDGAGTLTLGASNKINKLLIKAGVVNTVESGGVSQMPATVEFTNGTVYDVNSEGSYTKNNANFVVPDLCVGTLYADPRCDYNGSLTGGGTFNVYATGVRCYFNGDWSAFEGTIVPGLSKRGTYDPSFVYKSSTGLPKATLQMNSGVTFSNNGQDVEVAKVTGSGTLAGSGYYILVGGEDYTYSTPSTAPLIKRGANKITMYSAGKLSSSLTIEEGTVAVSVLSLSTKLNGNNSVSLKGTGVLQGQMYLNSLLMSGNSTLNLVNVAGTSPTKVVTSGILNASGNSVVKFLLADGKNSSLEIGSSLYLAGINVSLADGYTPKNGDTFTLWTCSTLATQPTDIALPSLPDGLYWDRSGLGEATGVLKVTDDPAGIDGVAASVASVYAVYDAAGMKLGEVECTSSELSKSVGELVSQPGTYIIRCKSVGKTAIRKLVLK